MSVPSTFGMTLQHRFSADFGFEKVFHDVHCIKGEEKCMFHESTTRILVF